MKNNKYILLTRNRITLCIIVYVNGSHFSYPCIYFALFEYSTNNIIIINAAVAAASADNIACNLFAYNALQRAHTLSCINGQMNGSSNRLPVRFHFFPSTLKTVSATANRIFRYFVFLLKNEMKKKNGERWSLMPYNFHLVTVSASNWTCQCVEWLKMKWNNCKGKNRKCVI